MSWVTPALVGCLFFAAHYLTLRAAAGKVPDVLGGLLLEGSAAAGLLLLLLCSPKSTVPATQSGIVFSVISGLCITGGVTALFVALRQGGPVSGTGTLALGGGVAIAGVCAPLFFNEALTPRRALGLALAALAMWVFATEKNG